MNEKIQPQKQRRELAGGTARGSPLFGWIVAAVIAVATVFAYKPAWNGGFIWDDDDYVVHNELLSAPDGLCRIWFSFDSPSQYFPLVYTTFRIEHALWGLNSSGYHWINLLLHVANALLLWRVLVRLKVTGAGLAAAIFALHPVQVESVAWITERKNVLMGLFFLTAVRAWIEFVCASSRRRWWFYVASLLSYTAALSAKTTACTLPAALGLVLWLRRERITRSRVIQIIPFVLLGFAAGLLTMWWERYHQGTHGAIFAFTPIERLLVASRAVWFYLSKLIWPVDLTFIYPRWRIDPSQAIQYVWVVAGLCAAGAIWLVRRRVGRSLESAAFFFIATLSPVLGFIMLYTFRYTFVADHYQYLASIGPITLFSAAFFVFASHSARARQIIFAGSFALICVLALLTWRQSHMYGDIEQLWRTTLAHNPGCWMAHNNLGVVLAQKGRTDEATTHYRAALALEPAYGDAEFNLGNALGQQGRTDEAIEHCRRAVTIQPKDPDTQVALANALFQAHRFDDAINHYREALAVWPDHAVANANLARTLLETGDADGVIAHAQRAVAGDRYNPDFYITLAAGLSAKKRAGEAISCYQKALRVAPSSVPAANNLAWLLATSRDAALRNGAEALRLAERANQISAGSNPVVWRTLAAGYAELGNFAEACRCAELAIRLASGSGADALVTQLRRELSTYAGGAAYRE